MEPLTRHKLIGPELFPIYAKVLGLNAGITVAVATALALTLGTPLILGILVPVVVQIAIVTLVFALIDRHQRRSGERRRLLDRYLRAVKPLLPKGQRDDILQELSANILAQIEDREAELGRRLSETEQGDILERFGPPLVVAGRYQTDQRSLSLGRQLIGPVLFPLYLKILCLNVGITIAACLVAAVALAGRQPVLQTIPAILSHIALQLGIVTLVFAAAESNAARFPNAWNRRRPSVTALARDWQMVPRAQSVVELIALAVFILWWLSLPRGFGSAASVLHGGPGWRVLYRPLLLLAAAGMAAPCINLFRPDWLRLRLASRLATTGIFVIVLCLSLRAGNWVVLAGAAQHVARYQRVVAGINRWVGFALIVTCVACGIQLLWDLWRLARPQRGRERSSAEG